MLMEDELHYDDDDENGEFEGIVNETDIINPSKDCDYDVDYNDMAARFESFLSRAQLASPSSSPSTSEDLCRVCTGHHGDGDPRRPGRRHPG